VSSIRKCADTSSKVEHKPLRSRKFEARQSFSDETRGVPGAGFVEDRKPYNPAQANAAYHITTLNLQPSPFLPGKSPDLCSLNQIQQMEFANQAVKVSIAYTYHKVSGTERLFTGVDTMCNIIMACNEVVI